MNPFEWPWDNDPAESAELARTTVRLRRDVRRLDRRMARIEREIRRMGRRLEEVARAPRPAPPGSEQAQRLVAEAQRTAAAYAARPSAPAASRAFRARNALLEYLAALETGVAPPSVPSASPPPPTSTSGRFRSHPSSAPSRPPRAEAHPPPGTEDPQTERAPLSQGEAPLTPATPFSVRGTSSVMGEDMVRWMRDAVSLLRTAAFSSEGHFVLRDQLVAKALEAMAQRTAAGSASHPPSAPGTGAGQAPSPPGGAPIGRPRLGPRRDSPLPPVAAVRNPAPPPPPADWPQPPRPAFPRAGAPRASTGMGSAAREAPAEDPYARTRQGAQDEGRDAWSPPSTAESAASAPEADGSEHGDFGTGSYSVAPPREEGGGVYPLEPKDPFRERWEPMGEVGPTPTPEAHTGEGSDGEFEPPAAAKEPDQEEASRGEPEPRRWWSYAPVPPPRRE